MRVSCPRMRIRIIQPGCWLRSFIRSIGSGGREELEVIAGVGAGEEHRPTLRGRFDYWSVLTVSSHLPCFLLLPFLLVDYPEKAIGS